MTELDQSAGQQVETHRSLRVLFADDEKSLQEFMRSELPRLGHEVTVCPDGQTAVKALEKSTFDAAILDLRMPGMTGIEVLEHLKQVSPGHRSHRDDRPRQHGDGHRGPAAGRLRLHHQAVQAGRDRSDPAQGRREARTEAQESGPANAACRRPKGRRILVGNSPAMAAVHRLIATVAPTDSTVLILGETGTGKELAARTVCAAEQAGRHAVRAGQLRRPAGEPGRERAVRPSQGRFTGADRDHKGLFEVANGGTLFLDELGELNKNIQVKLLRFLESGEIRRVGETEPFRIDVRVLCATNRDLRQMIQEDEFREDLYLPHQHVRDSPAAAARTPAGHSRPGPAPAGRVRPTAGRAGRRPADAGGDRRAAGTRMAGQRPRAGQRDGARLHHRRRRPDHCRSTCRTRCVPAAASPADADRSTAAPACRPAGSARPRTLQEIEMEHVLRVLEKHDGNKPPPPRNWGSASRRCTTSSIDWRKNAKRRGEAALLSTRPVASWTTTLKVWDTSTGAEVLSLHGHTSDVSCVAIRADGKRIASGSADRTVKMWDVVKE